MNTAVSKNGISIRLTDERWAHITDEHCELAGLRLEVLETIENPIRIFEGSREEFIAVIELTKGKFLAVVYKEFQRDGFIITAFITKRIKSLFRRRQVWSN